MLMEPVPNIVGKMKVYDYKLSPFQTLISKFILDTLFLFFGHVSNCMLLFLLKILRQIQSSKIRKNNSRTVINYLISRHRVQNGQNGIMVLSYITIRAYNRVA